MAKIEFDDHSYIEARKSDNPGKIIIIVSARDGIDPMKKTTNACEMSAEEFKRLISDVG